MRKNQSVSLMDHMPPNPADETPVVYACRMGGADAGYTYINQPAFEQLFDAYSAICDFEERDITIKHEGKTLAYSVELNGKKSDYKLPIGRGR